MILFGRYMTALCRRTGSSPTVDHVRVAGFRMRVDLVRAGVEDAAVREHEHERVERRREPARSSRSVHVFVLGL